MFADDNLMLLQGDQIDLILQMLIKIGQYRLVAGLILNLFKCEIMAINCQEQDIQRLVSQTNMKRVNTLKHLGLLINEDGEMTFNDNLAPVQAAMDNIANSLSTSSSTPLGRSLYAKFLLSIRYLHRIQNFTFSDVQLSELRKSVLLLTWTRHRVGSDTSSTRVHIAGDRVAHPISVGGLSVPDPTIQSQAVKFSWLRKMSSPDHNLVWVKILESLLLETNGPNISTHLILGTAEWLETSLSLWNISKFWSDVFRTCSLFINLSHRVDRVWHLIPIIGHEDTDFATVNISSLSYRNPVARSIIWSGLNNVGQLFELNSLGQIDINNLKSFPVIEQEFNIVIPGPLRNSLIGLVNMARAVNRYSPSLPLPETICTAQSLLRVHPSGCQVATRLLLSIQRQHWEWGDFPRSYSTYLRDGIINLSSAQFSAALTRSRRTSLPPSVQWTSIQILIRTLWTNVKEQRTARNLTNPQPISNLCSNCQAHPEHTIHLIYQCTLAQQVWSVLESVLTEVLRSQQPVALSRDNIMYNHPIGGVSDSQKYDVIDITMVIKHAIYRLKFRENMNRLPTPRLLIVIAALDLEKAVKVRNYFNKESIFINEVTNVLKARAGF